MEKKTSARVYYLDWLRVLGILAVFIYHSSRFFNMEDFLVKNPTWYPWVEYWNLFATTWMMPLMFVVSGASLFYALGKGGVLSFVKDKALRLLVPWLVFVLTHQSLQFYLDRLSHGQFSGSYFQYLLQYYTNDLDLFGAHLWYLWLLFVFSVILYPLMCWLRGRGRGVLSKLGDLFALPGAVYALALPIILVVVLGDPSSPWMERNAGWPLLLYWWFILAGFVIVSHDGLQAGVQRLRWLSLVVALVTVAVSLVLILGLPGELTFGTPRFGLALGLRAVSAWCWVLAFLGFGSKHLKLRTPFLTYANEAVLPFYILHQTALISVGYFVVQWPIPDLLKWLIIVPVSFAIIMALYELVVRRFNVMRVLFGMKPLRRAEPVATQPAQPAPEKA
jgi:peptidoglycan/LPS O-acetylase OafA/YrhL